MSLDKQPDRQIVANIVVPPFTPTKPVEPHMRKARGKASERQVRANRANARQSTGPKTAGGKSRSSQNRLSHGLTATKDYFLPNESRREFETFRKQARDYWKRSNVHDTAIVELWVWLSWLLLRRAPRFEAGVFRWAALTLFSDDCEYAKQNKIQFSSEAAVYPFERILDHLIRHGDLDHVNRYRTPIHRQFVATTKLLIEMSKTLGSSDVS